MNGIRCDKLSMAVAEVRANPDKYKKDFNTIVTFLTQYIDKKAPTQSVNVTQTRPAKPQKTNTSCSTFRGKIELKKYSQEEYDSMLAAQHQQLYELQRKARL